MNNKPKKPKDSTSMKKVAKTYRKTTERQDGGWSGARYFNEGAKPIGLGSATRKVTFKPAPKQVTLGGTRQSKPATIKKKGRA